eukprot:247301_1
MGSCLSTKSQSTLHQINIARLQNHDDCNNQNTASTSTCQSQSHSQPGASSDSVGMINLNRLNIQLHPISPVVTHYMSNLCLNIHCIDKFHVSGLSQIDLIDNLPELESWLLMQNVEQSDQWLKKWVTVKDMYLIYSKEKKDIGNVVNEIDITNDNVLHLSTVCDAIALESQTVFKIIYKEKHALKSYTFQCESIENMNFWVKGLKSHMTHIRSMIQYLGRTDEDSSDHDSSDDSTLYFPKYKFKSDVFLKKLENLANNMKQNANKQHIDISSLIDDYSFLLQNHNNHDDIQYIHEKLGGACDSKQCDIFKRHYRNTNNETEWRQQIIDKIHCFYRHTYDIGYMLNAEHRSELKINPPIKKHFKICEMLKNQRTANGRVTNKFNQVLICDNIKKNNTYNFGTQFKYGYENEDKYKILDDIKEWTEPNCVEVISKYKSIKEELTMNDISTITMIQFNDEYNKVKVHFFTSFRQKQYPNIEIIQLLALMIYCNYDELQNKFSKTYYSNIKEHNNFYHLGKHIKIAIHQFGIEIKNDNIKAFYHGIS